MTVTRTEQRAGDAPADVTVLTRQDIDRSPSQTLDDLLRQVPGFSLFRRTSSLVGHPTTQGVSLRGIGPSGTSRALVLLDGVPINDPFGGWVYWDRIPLQGVEQVEVVRGGGSSAGATTPSAASSTSSREARRARGALRRQLWQPQHAQPRRHRLGGPGPFRLGLEGNYFSTDGYPIVKKSDRGSIDVNATSQHSTFNGRLELVLSPDLSFYLRGNHYDEDRGNGTPVQSNDTEAGSFATGGRLRTGDGSDWSFSLYGDFQKFTSTFSTQAANRNSETLALDQRVPSSSVGGALQWSRRFGSHLLLAGGDFRWIEGETHEKVYNAGAFLRRRDAGGQQALVGVFVQDVFTPTPQWEIVGGVRGDYWLAYDGFRHDTPPPAGIPPSQSFANNRLAGGESAPGGALARDTVHRPARLRVPGLPGAHPQRAVPGVPGSERRHRRESEPRSGAVDRRRAGHRAAVGALPGRFTGYWNDVKDLVANVTLATPLPDCPPGTTCRQRQNLDLSRIRGLETELTLRPVARVAPPRQLHLHRRQGRECPAAAGLEGNRLAQVPQHGATLGVSYENPQWLTASAMARFIGPQYEDDQNTLRLGSYWVFDLFLSRRLAKWAEIYVGIENLFNTTYSVGRSSDGVVSIGAPLLVHGGIRISLR